MSGSKNNPIAWMDSSAKGRNGFPEWALGHGISQEMLDHQRKINGVHDDMLYASALGMLRYKQPWYRRWWIKLKAMFNRRK